MNSNHSEVQTKQFTCPACQGPATELTRGVCPKCAESFKTKHGRKTVNPVAREETSSFPRGGYFDDTSERVASTADAESGLAAMERFAFAHGIRIETAIEMEAELESRHNGDSKEKLREFFHRMSAGAAWVLSYKGDVRMALRCLVLITGFRDVAGCPTGSLVELARACSTRKHPVSKATVNKCLRSLESYLNLPQYQEVPPAPGQRDREARNNMSIATSERWHKRKP